MGYLIIPLDNKGLIMKLKWFVCFSTIILGGYSLSSNAEVMRVNGYYQGFGLGSTEFNVYEDESLQFTTIFSQLGYQFSPYIAFEGRLGVGVNEESTLLNGDVYTQEPLTGTITSKPVKTQVDSGLQLQTSIFLKASYPVSSQFGIFLFTGYARNKLSYSDDYQRFVEDVIGSNTNMTLISEENYHQEGLTYGAGIDYMLNQRWQVVAEYQYFDVEQGDIFALNLSVNYRF